MLGGSNDFTEVVGRHIGGHSDRNTGCAIYQEVRKCCWKYKWLKELAVVVSAKVHSVFICLIDHCHRRRGESGFGVTHGGWTCIKGTEVSVSIDQGKAGGERLG